MAAAPSLLKQGRKKAVLGAVLAGCPSFLQFSKHATPEKGNDKRRNGVTAAGLEPQQNSHQISAASGEPHEQHWPKLKLAKRKAVKWLHSPCSEARKSETPKARKAA